VPENEYDIVTVGGGLGGSSLAKVMAEKGARALVLEREREFKDRVRGEAMVPWGVAEAQELGIYDLLCETCGHKAWWFDVFLGPLQIMHRDLQATTPRNTPMLVELRRCLSLLETQPEFPITA
jgi:menaquinone-9 beta-reductase